MQAEAWSDAVETAPNGKPTVKHVEAAVAKVIAREPDARRTPKAAPVMSKVEITIPWQPAPGQTNLFSDDENDNEQARVEAGEPDDFALSSADDPSELDFIGFDRSVQKVLGLVCATEDFGIDNVVARLPPMRRAAIARGLDDLIGKLTAWSARMKGAKA